MHTGEDKTNSKKVLPGQIYVAIKGHTVDGHNYIKEAIEKGCAKVISEKDIANLNIPYEKVKSTKKYLQEEIPKAYSEELKI